MHIDHGLTDTGRGELVQHVVEQRLAGNAHQRLRHVVGQWAHAQAKTGGEDHGFAWCNGHSLSFSNHQNRAADHTTVIRRSQRRKRP
jgi:hypothetical protein